MSTNLSIDYVELPASDLGAVKAFYQQIFGWEFVDYGPDYCSFSDANVNGGFYKSEALSSYQAGSILIVFYAADLEGVRNSVVESGGKIVQDIFSFPGGRRFHFTDPHGNELAIWSDQD